MDDRRIVELFLNRSEEALLQIDIKYGRYCHRVAFNVLGNAEDSEECVNDAYMRVWGSIPPNEQSSLSAYVGKITRNIALDKLRQKNSGNYRQNLMAAGGVSFMFGAVSYAVLTFANLIVNFFYI